MEYPKPNSVGDINSIIYFYGEKDSYGEFSNYYPSPFTLNGIRYSTVEHFYQSQKFMGPNATPRSLEYARFIINQNTPNKAKILANQQIRGGYKWVQELNNIIRNYQDVKIRSDWEDIKDNIMRKGVMHKFLQNQNLSSLLSMTNDKILVEHTSRDNYWGDAGNGTGQNKLGKILMETRDILKYKINPIGTHDYWIIRSILIIGDIDVAVLNQVGVKYILDISGESIVSNKILGQTLPDPISVYQGQIIFVSPTESVPFEQLADLTIQSLGKGYVSYVFATIEKYNEFLTVLFNRLYELSIEVSRELIQRLIRK
jgi:N-glycosidase YbiA